MKTAPVAAAWTAETASSWQPWATIPAGRQDCVACVVKLQACADEAVAERAHVGEQLSIQCCSCAARPDSSLLADMAPMGHQAG